MAQRLIQFRLEVWYHDGRKYTSIFFRSTRSKVYDRVHDILSSVNFKGGVFRYILFQI